MSVKQLWRSGWPLVLLASSGAAVAMALLRMADGRHLEGLYWAVGAALGLKAAHERSGFSEVASRKG